MNSILHLLWKYNSTLIIVLTPIVLLPMVLIVQGTEVACGYVILLMAIYWMTEALPLAVTSLMPLFLFPLMGIMPGDEVSMVYTKDSVWLFVGSFFIAIAVEYTNLHFRIAVIILQMVGTSAQCLMFGFMCTTAFLSMFITNTATTAMMLPIVEAVLRELLSHKEDEESELELSQIEETAFVTEKKNHENGGHINTTFQSDNEKVETTVVEKEQDGAVEFSDQVDVEINQREESEKDTKIRKGMTICVPYSASIGGIATLTGTPPNIVLAGQYKVLYPDAETTITYGNWLAYNLPCAIVMLFIAYIWLVWYYIGIDRKFCSCCGNQSEKDMKIKRVIQRQKDSLGPMTWAEATVLIVFILTVLLWLFRDPGFIGGWSALFKDDYITDGTVAMGMAFLLFILPDKRPNFLRKSTAKEGPTEPVLHWKTINDQFPWGVMFLLGAGMAIAQGSEDSGLSDWIGDQLAALGDLDDWVLCLIITTICCLFTEIASNTATASLFIPIISRLAQVLEIHPLYLLIPSVVSCSLAFMLPVATPPNAIAFAYGHLTVWDMVKTGFILNIIGILLVNAFINSYGMWFWGLSTFPAWAAITETTTAPPPICIPSTTPFVNSTVL